MKKAIVCALAALALVAAAQPLEERAKALLERKRETTAAAPGVTFETQLGVKQESSLLDVTLYFRYGETNLRGRREAGYATRGDGGAEHRRGAADRAGRGA